MYRSQNESAHNDSDFEEHHNPTGKAYNTQQSKDKIRIALGDMGVQGYDFRYKTWDFQQLEQYKKCQKHRHRSYLRHECWRCVQNTNSQVKKQKRFTTSKGTAQVRYKFMKLKKFLTKYPDFKKKKHETEQQIIKLKYPYIFMWDFYIYHMKCKNCVKRGGYSQLQTQQNPELVYATPFIYQGVLEQVIEELKQIIRRKLNPEHKRKPNVRRPKGPKVPILINHLSRLCEACAKGICKNYKADQRKDDDGYDSNSFLDSSSNSSRGSSRKSSRRSSGRSNRRSNGQPRQNLDTPRSHSHNSDQNNNNGNGNNSRKSSQIKQNSVPQSPKNVMKSIQSIHSDSSNSYSKSNNNNPVQNGSNSRSSNSNSISGNNSQNKAKYIEKAQKKSNINLEGQLLFTQKLSQKKQSKKDNRSIKNMRKKQQDQISQKSSQSLQSLKSSASYRSSISNKSNKSSKSVNSENIFSYSNSNSVASSNKKEKKSEKSQQSVVSQRKYKEKVVKKEINDPTKKSNIYYMEKSKQIKYMQKDNYSTKSEPLYRIK